MTEPVFGLRALAPTLQPYARALWPAAPRLAALPPQLATQRPCMRDGAWLLPEAWRGVRGPAARSAYLAAVAHAAAHGQHGGPPQTRQGLKPLQQALLGVLEDARVEWLAMQALPGLRALWAAQWSPGREDAAPLTGAEPLLARLARVLLTGEPDPHPWIAKARQAFYADGDGRRLALTDPAALRRAASLLGHDLGQMRLPFNARQYVVEPAYRDDNAHLWSEPAGEVNAIALPEPAGARAAAGDDTPSSARAPDEQQQSPDQPPDAAPQPDRDDAADAWPAELAAEPADAPPPAAAPDGARTAPPVLCLIEQARYPEWDRLIDRLRPDWTAVRVWQPASRPQGADDAGACAEGSSPLMAQAGADTDALARHTARLIGQALLAPGHRLRGRAADGDRLHLRAAVQAALDRRTGRSADARVYRAREPATAPLSVMLLVDVSVSTARRLAAGPALAAGGHAGALADAETKRPADAADAVDAAHDPRGANDPGAPTASFAGRGPAAGATLLDASRHAARIALAALDRLGAASAAYAFSSNGREQVDLVRLKAFDEACADAAVAARLAALQPGGSTRIGAARRHAVRQLQSRPEARKRLILLTDGEPHDIDVHDPRYLVEDLRHAVRQAAAAGVDVACLDTGGLAHARLRGCFAPGRHQRATPGARLAAQLCALVSG